MATVQKTVSFVRHGESDDNPRPVFQSEDAPLSRRGHRQARVIAERISNLAFDALISSTLPRAADTARCIADATGKQPEFSDLFIERRKPSSIEGKPHTDEAAARLWRAWDETMHTPGSERIEDAENYDAIIERSDNALAYLEERPESSLVVVTHGNFLRTIMGRVLLGGGMTGDNLRSIQASAEMENTGITVLRYTDGFERDFGWQLWTYNDHAHFAD